MLMRMKNSNVHKNWFLISLKVPGRIDGTVVGSQFYQIWQNFESVWPLFWLLIYYLPKKITFLGKYFIILLGKFNYCKWPNNEQSMLHCTACSARFHKSTGFKSCSLQIWTSIETSKRGNLNRILNPNVPTYLPTYELMSVSMYQH